MHGHAPAISTQTKSSIFKYLRTNKQQFINFIFNIAGSLQTKLCLPRCGLKYQNND